MKRITMKIGIILCLLCSSISIVYADDSAFYIEEINSDGSIEVIESVRNYIEAKAIYDAHVANTNNIQIRQGDVIWKMKYGVVLFATSDTCDYNVTYLSNAGDGYTNGCYGIDAAYTGSSTPGYLDFYLSGVYGSTTSDDVEMLPIETAVNVSNYRVADGKLYHQIKTDMSQSYYSSIIYLGDAPQYLQDDREYYSYDGHYFYQSDDRFLGFHQMIDDLEDHVHTHAINADQPFYHYYQYVSHRTTTNYSEAEINQYLEDQLHIKGSLTTYVSIATSYHGILTQSLLKDSAAAFLQYQDQFGTNAMMMLALAMNESATGRSYLAYTRNNLFGHAAFDSAVEENASRYDSVSKSVYSHALHYLQNSYLDPSSFTWHGAYFGNKASGMNVTYASDPYWGEKAAQYYLKMDEALGEKDKNAYMLAIPTTDREIAVYAQPDVSGEVLYTTAGLDDFAFVVLAQDGDFFRIQSDPSQSEAYYSFEDCIAYVKKDDITIVNEVANPKEVQRYPITFDAQEGYFENGQSTLTLMIKEGNVPSILPPIKEGWLFVGWNQELSAATKAMTYRAQYAKIQTAQLSEIPKQDYISGEQLDVSGGVLTITTIQGETKTIPLDSSMTSGFDPDVIGKQSVNVHWQGVHTAYDVMVKEENASIQGTTFPRIQTLLENTSIFDDLNDEQIEEIISIKQAMDEDGIPYLSNDGIRLLDTFIQKAYGSSLNIHISDEDTGISVSGLSIAASLHKPSFFPQKLSFTFAKDIDREKETLLQQVAEGNGYTLDYSFSLDGNTLSNRILIALPKTQETQENAYYMLLRYEEGEVYQVPISQSDTLLSFSTDTLGDYALAYRLTNQTYGGNDILENNSTATNGSSILDYLLWVLIILALIILIIITYIVRKKRKRPKQKPKRKKQNRQYASHNDPKDYENSYPMQ